MKNVKPSTNFWLDLDKPILGLSPMDGVSDHPYRFIQKKYGSPDIIYTEFTSVEGVCHGALRLLKDFLYDETQRPIVSQVYGTTPEFFRQTAIVLCQLGFDGIDINMGCPAKNVESSGAGAALIKNPKLAQEIIKATKQGVSDYLSGKRTKDCPNISAKIIKEVEKRHAKLPEIYQNPRSIPVSVKTRIGYSESVVDEWIKTLLEMQPACIAIHGRTLKQQYSGISNWEEIGKAVKIRDHFAQNDTSSKTLILGNGDTSDRDHALKRVRDYGVDGVLIGRGSMGNPFVFRKKNNDFSKGREISGRIRVCLEHCQVFESTYKSDEKYNFLPMRKHLGWYVKGIERAKEIRSELFQADNAQEVNEILEKYQLLGDV